MYTLRNNQKGFTLIEALIAIFIFSVALVSLITISARGVTGAAQARDQVVAHFLAQEGIELMRNVRDTRIVNQDPSPLFGGSNDMPCYISDPCAIALDITGSPFFYKFTTPGGDTLDVNENSGVMVYESTGGDKFYREVFYEKTSSDDKIQVHSVVRWSNGAIPRQVHLTSVITNWGQANP